MIIITGDIPSWNRTSFENWDLASTIYPGAVDAVSSGFMPTNGSSLFVCVVSFGSYGSAVTAYLSMGGTNFIVLNETDEASGGWATLGKSVGNATIVTFPGCIITFREQNVVVQMQFTLGTPGSGLDRMAPDPWMMDIAQQQSAEIHHQVDKLS